MLTHTSYVLEAPCVIEPQGESFATHYFEPKAITFTYQGENLTFYDESGRLYPRVTLRRSFPLSGENTYVVVRAPDNEPDRGTELGVIRDCKELEARSRQAVERELRQFYLVPVIQKINSIREEFGFLYWHVDTDRGVKQFIMRDSIIGNVRQVGQGRWLIIDINQTRYEIREFDRLDERSQNALGRYLLL